MESACSEKPACVSFCERVSQIVFCSSRRRHTNSDRDWSSDVCSSDLAYARDRKAELAIETVDGCFDRRFREFVAKVEDFPTGAIFSEETVKTLLACIKEFDRLSPDERSEERRVRKEGRSRGSPYH